MARSLNKAVLIGNLGSGPEIRTTTDGTKVAGLSVATNRNWTDRDGQAQERTEWHRVVAWAKLAEIAEQYLSRGDRVYIEGEIQYRSYEDRDGATRYVTEIRAREMVTCRSENRPLPCFPGVGGAVGPQHWLSPAIQPNTSRSSPCRTNSIAAPTAQPRCSAFAPLPGTGKVRCSTRFPR